MSLLFFLPFLTAAADDAGNAYVHQMEKRIMAAWHLPKRSAGLTVAQSNRPVTKTSMSRRSRLCGAWPNFRPYPMRWII